MKKINKTALFLILTFLISFSMVLFFKLFGGQYSGLQGTVFALFYMFVPAISVIIVQKVIYNEEIVKSNFISFKLNIWFLVAWLIPPLISFGAFGIALLFPDVSYTAGAEGIIGRFEHLLTSEQIEEMKKSYEMLPIHPIWLALLSGLFAGASINALAGFGEELGWRGFLLNRFRKMRFIKASLIIGFIWGVWHAPLILMGHNYPNFPEFGALMMTIWCILLSPLFLYITIKARSVIAASVMHGALNGTYGLSIMLLNGGNELTVGVAGLAGFIALIIITAGFFLYDFLISKEKLMLNRIDDYL